MVVLMWMTLLFHVGGSAGLSTESCKDRFCITVEKEITAEAGLCVIIPCSISESLQGRLGKILWFKCESKQECDKPVMIVRENNNGVQDGFKGRVSLLEPIVVERNCSIIINDLTESDSGSYQLRLAGSMFFFQREFPLPQISTVSVKELSQKPTVVVPPLTEGQQATLTCTAPGLCSGSYPDITWTWRGRGEDASHIAGNVTNFMIERVTDVTWRHSSTLTFEAAATQHLTDVTCKVSFTNHITTEETVTLKVHSFPKILENSGCEIASEVLTCVCISQGSPVPTIKWALLKNREEYIIVTSVSKQTVNSTISIPVEIHSSTVECLSSNDVGKEKQSLNIVRTSKRQKGPVQYYGLSSVVLPWTVAAVSLIVNVICVICMLKHWNTRHKVKPNDKDRTYTSLQRTGPSPEYDVIG